MIRLACFGFVALVPGSALAEDVSVQLETSVASSYVNRGIVQYANRADPSSQNTLALTMDHLGPGALSLTAWSAVALSEYATQPGTALELDLTAAYAFRAGPLAVATGYTVGLFPSAMQDTPLDGSHEVWGTASLDNPYVVPAVGGYVEVLRQEGVYLTLGASRDLHHDAWTLSPALSVGMATYRKYQGGDQPARPHLNDVSAVLGLKRELDDGIYATARLCYALRGTPAELMEMDPSWGFDGRSSMFGVLAVGVVR